MFHCSTHSFSIGDRVQCGRWGAGFNNYTYGVTNIHATNAWRLASELILEQVRHLHFSSKPSRFNCTFAFETLQEAQSCPANPGTMIFEVTPTDSNPTIHRGSLSILNANSRFNAQFPFLQHNRQIALNYWAGMESGLMELAIGCDLNIIRIV